MFYSTFKTRSARKLIAILLLLDTLLTVTGQTKVRDDPRFKRPAGMTDAQYAKLMDSVRGKQMTKHQADDWWPKVQNWWKGVLARLKETGDRINAFFDKIFTPPATTNGAPGMPGNVPGFVPEVDSAPINPTDTETIGRVRATGRPVSRSSSAPKTG